MKKLVLLITDYFGTVHHFGRNTCDELIGNVNYLKDNLNEDVKVKWVLLSGTVYDSMEYYVQNFNKIIKESNNNLDFSVDLGIARNGYHIYSDNYNQEKLLNYHQAYDKGDSIKSIINFYSQLGYDIESLIYIGDDSPDILAFKAISGMGNVNYKSASFISCASYITKHVDYVAEKSNINGVIEIVKWWSQKLKEA